MNALILNELLIKIANGDNEAFGELYDKTKRGMLAFLSNYLSYQDTEDAMQSVYLRIKTKIHLYQSGTNARAWMLQIAKNYAIDELRVSRRIISMEKEEVNFCENGFVVDAMRRCLNDEEFEIVVLHVLWGYKHKEIAKERNCPTGTITSKYKRAVEKVKKSLKEEQL